MTPWVKRLIFANVVMLLLQQAYPPIFGYLALLPAAVPFRPWTVFTYMFLHAGFMHIFFNMLALYFFGPRLEARLGSNHFLALYFASGLVGALASFTSPYTPVIGASGAVYGILLAYARYWPRDRIYIWGVFPVEVRVLVIFLTGLSLFGGISGGGNVAHFAHLGGFLGGYLYIKWYEYRLPARRFKAKLQPQLEKKRVDKDDIERWAGISRADLHPVNLGELDRVLTKIREEGVESLTPDERAFLDRFSART